MFAINIPIETLKKITLFYNPSIDTWVGDRSWDITVENLPNIDGLLIVDEDASFVVLPKDTTFIPWSGKNLNVIDNPCYHNTRSNRSIFK